IPAEYSLLIIFLQLGINPKVVQMKKNLEDQDISVHFVTPENAEYLAPIISTLGLEQSEILSSSDVEKNETKKLPVLFTQANGIAFQKMVKKCESESGVCFVIGSRSEHAI